VDGHATRGGGLTTALDNATGLEEKGAIASAGPTHQHTIAGGVVLRGGRVRSEVVESGITAVRAVRN
jgi:hypothetical protein